MESEEAQGQVGGDAPHQRPTDADEIERQIGAHPLSLHPQLRVIGTADDEEGAHPHRTDEAVEVVPVVVGHQHHPHHQKSQEEPGSSSHGGDEAEHEAPIPHALPQAVDPPGDGAGQV